MTNKLYRSISAFALLASLSITGTQALAQDASASKSLPDSPGAIAPQVVAQLQGFQQPTSTPPQTASQSTSPSAPVGNQKPVGTAVAEVPPPTGVAVSSSAGAAIAPAKQRRVRTLVIEVAAIIGAGVAVGTVVALSSASPSRPPGSH